MSPKPQGKQSGKNKKPVKVKFPAAVYWLKNRYCRMDHTEVKTEEILFTSKPCEGKQYPPPGTDMCTFWGNEVNINELAFIIKRDTLNNDFFELYFCLNIKTNAKQ